LWLAGRQQKASQGKQGDQYEQFFWMSSFFSYDLLNIFNMMDGSWLSNLSCQVSPPYQPNGKRQNGQLLSPETLDLHESRYLLQVGNAY
jgi:hypothetical protein